MDKNIIKKLITTFLILFVVASVIFLFVKDSKKGKQKEENSNIASSDNKKSSKKISPKKRDNKKVKKDQFCILDDKSCGELKNHHINVYYFHTTYRCPTCKKIERYTTLVVKNRFKKDLQDGDITFNHKNIQKKENKHYIKEFNLYTKSVIFEEIKDGKRVRWKNLDKVWKLVSNKEKFENYIQSELKEFLKSIK